MSDTPRTDALLLTVKDCSYVAPHPLGEYVAAGLARQLERENAALRKDVLELCTFNTKGSEREYSLRGRIEQFERRIEQLERENAALREDKEILDWLDANVDAIMLKLQPNSFRLDVREMVRKARKEGQR